MNLDKSYFALPDEDLLHLNIEDLFVNQDNLHQFSESQSPLNMEFGCNNLWCNEFSSMSGTDLSEPRHLLYYPYSSHYTSDYTSAHSSNTINDNPEQKIDQIKIQIEGKVTLENESSCTEKTIQNKKPSRKRARVPKNKEQVQILLNEFEKNSQWNPEKMSSLSARTGLPFAKVYKWHWDKKYEIEQSYSAFLRKSQPFLVSQTLENSSTQIFKIIKCERQ